MGKKNNKKSATVSNGQNRKLRTGGNVPPAPGSFFESVSNILFWTDAHGKSLEKAWSLVPESFGQLVVTISMFVLGLTIRGQPIKIF